MGGLVSKKCCLQTALVDGKMDEALRPGLGGAGLGWVGLGSAGLGWARPDLAGRCSGAAFHLQGTKCGPSNGRLWIA